MIAFGNDRSSSVSISMGEYVTPKLKTALSEPGAPIRTRSVLYLLIFHLIVLIYIFSKRLRHRLSASNSEEDAERGSEEKSEDQVEIW